MRVELSMVKVECDGCKAPYQIDEKRIPEAGLKMRCPKCGTNLLVTKPAAGDPGQADLPTARPAGGPGAPPRAAPPRPPPPPRPKAAPPPRAPAQAPAFGEIDEPLPGGGFGEIDLKMDMSGGGAPPETDLPAVRGAPQYGGFGEVDLPMAAGDHADLPMAAGGRADLPMPSAARPRGAPPPVPTGPGGGFAPRPPATQGDAPWPSAPPEDDFPMAAGGHTDLPSPAGGRADLPMPAHGGAPPTAVKRRNPTVNFGDIDLPIAPSVGLPAAQPPGAQPAGAPPQAHPPVRGRTVNLGDVDLPMAPTAGLPVPAGAPPVARPVRGRTVNFGDIDLPSVPEDEGLPDGRGFGELDLPLVSDDLPSPAGAGLPAPAYGAGLPAAAAYGAGLPSPAYGAGLPSPAHGAGLPSPAHGAGLPSPAYGAGLPAPAYGAGLPAPAYGAGLPSPAGGSGLPMPAYGSGLPMAAQGQGLPMAVQGGGLPMPAQGQGLPMPMPGGGLPMPAQGQGYPMAMPGGGLPMPAQGQGYPMAMPGGGLPTAADVGYPELAGFGGEAALDGAPRSSAFDDSDRAVPQMDGQAPQLGAVGIDIEGGAARAAVGDEADLAAIPLAPGEGAVPSQRRAREHADPVKKGNARKLAVFVAVAAALTGGAFSLVPSVGPFGAYFVIDKINAKSNAAALDALRQAVDAQLDEDTYAASSAAIDRCKAALGTMPRFAPAAAHCAYVVLDRGLRFGRRTEDEALAKQLLAKAGGGGEDAAILATAALDVLAGQPGKARGPATALAQKAAQDVDAAVVAAYVELADAVHDGGATPNAPAAKAAVAAWTAAVTVHKSARTLFGLARAQLAAGDPKAAEKSARDALALSKAHAGARTLIATAIGADPIREAEAIALLKQVTDEGDTSRAASEGEMVDAFTATGYVHLGRSRMSAAAQAFAGALKLNPLAVRALIGNGEVFYRSGRFSEALARYEAATNADPASIVAKVGIAKTYISLERMKEAKDMLKVLRDAKPTEPLVILWLGKAEEALGNKKEAETAYTEAIKAGGNRPEVVDAYVALAHLLSAIGRTEDANTRLAEAAKKFPDFPALHRARGEVALQMGRYDEARGELEAALVHDEDLGARFNLGVALRRMRRFDEASAVFDKVGTIDPDFPGLALERGVLFQETGKSDMALESYRKALEKAPNDVDLKLRVGSTQVIAGHALEAIKMLEEVRKARPNSAEANHFLGRALLVKGENLVEAMRYLELAANIDTNRAEYHLYVGWAANELNQPGKAGPALNRAIELDHELGDAYWQRGITLQKQTEIQDALRDLQTALAKRPSRYEAWATIALCQEDLQKWAEAEKAWRAAIAGNDDVAEWHYRLGKLLDGHGNKASVQAELEKALEIANRPGQPHYLWLYDLHFLLAETLHRNPANKARTIEEYQHFLELAPPGLAYRDDARKALLGMGVRIDH
jgi:predicted Zn finger-like uncharacterized protein